MKYIYALFFSCFGLFSFAQNIEWITEYKNNPPYTFPGKGVGVDNNGNTYLMGATKPSSTIHYIAKFSPSGQEIWCDSLMTGVNLDVIRTDSAGNSYLIGRFYQYANIGGIILTDSANHMICFYAKYNTNGVCQWAYRLEERTSIADIYPLPSGEFYLGGWATNTLYLPNDTIPAGHGFIGKLNSSGAFIWAKPIGTISAMNIKIDPSGNFYIAGNLYGAYAVGEGASVIYISGNSSVNAFIAKFDSSLNVQWAKVGYSNGASVCGLGVDSSGNVYVAGTMGYYMSFSGHTVSTGGDNMFLVKYDTYGNYQWMKYSYSTGLNDCFGLAVDDAGNSYVTGGLAGDTTYFDTYIVRGGPYVIKYDTYGNFLWGLDKQIIPSGIQGEGRALCKDNSGNILIAGNFGSNSKSFLTKISENNTGIGIILSENNSLLNIYPNPTGGNFQINYTSPDSYRGEKTKLQLNIIDSKGKIVYTETFQGDYNKAIDLGAKAKGVYFVEVIAADKKRSVKRIVLN